MHNFYNCKSRLIQGLLLKVLDLHRSSRIAPADFLFLSICVRACYLCVLSRLGKFLASGQSQHLYKLSEM